MKLFVDMENKRLVQGLSSNRSASAPVFTQGDHERLEIHLLDADGQSLYNDKVFNPQSDFLRAGIARFRGEPKVLTLCAEYTALQDGGAQMEFPLNTTALDTALGENISLDAYLEIEYTSAGLVSTVLQTPCKVKNNLLGNAPQSELQNQYYTKAECNGLFAAATGSGYRFVNGSIYILNADTQAFHKLSLKNINGVPTPFIEETPAVLP